MAEQQGSSLAGASLIRHVVEELGLIVLYKSSTDIKLLICQRFVRVFAFGCSTLILVTFLTDLGFSEDQIGLFMTLTLVGDAIISLVLTLFADRIGRRATLVLGSLLMTVSGFVFGLSNVYWILLLAAVVGVITPSGNEIGPFRAIEESIIGWLVPQAERNDIFAWYIMLGPIGLATGTIACGWIVNSLVEDGRWTVPEAYRGIFYLYGALGFAKAILSLLLSPRCELEQAKPDQEESDPLIGEPTAGATPPSTANRAKWSLLPSIDKNSIPTVIKLCLLFGFDSISNSLMPLSWQVYYFKIKFDLPDSLLGTIFFASNIVAAASVLVASSIAKRLGNVRTIVLASTCSAIAQMALPLPPALPLVLVILFVRSCVQTMETAPRAAFLAAVLKPSERTAVIGTIGVVRTATSAIAPLATGVLAANDLLWTTFILSGAIKILYSIVFLVAFAAVETEAEDEIVTTQGGEESNMADDRSQ